MDEHRREVQATPARVEDFPDTEQLHGRRQRQYNYNYSYYYNHHQQRPQQQQPGDDDIYEFYTTQNNLGVMLLREKRYLDAANCFCQAVKYVNERSLYHCPYHHQQHEEPTSQHRDIDASQTRSTTDDNELFDSNDVHVRRRPSSPQSRRIDSFYLLLDGENGHDESSSGSSSSTDHDSINPSRLQRQNSCNDGCQRPCCHPSQVSFNQTTTTSTRTNTHRNNNNRPSSPLEQQQQQQQHKGTFVFRNPIIVSKRGELPTMTRHTRVPVRSRSPTPTRAQMPPAPPTSYAARNGWTALQGQPTAITTTAASTIDKENCAKLSLISVYNMALTYHLAALDNNDSSSNSSNIHGGDSKTTEPATVHRTRLDRVDRRSNKRNLQQVESHNNGNSSSSARTKRPRVGDALSVSATTTMTPYGECNTPHPHNGAPTTEPSIPHTTTASSDRDSSATPTPSISNHPDTNRNNRTSVDRVLLAQALAYYEIAYRILVSEQRVLVSQAMVILNNIGHIHRLMGKEENAQKCFQRLLTTMVYLQQTGNYHQISHWDSFLTNVIDLMVSPADSHKKFAPAA